MMAFCPEHPKWDQNPKFTTLSETTSIPTTFIYGVPSPPPRGGWLAYLPKESSGKEFFDFIFVYLFICFFMAKEYNEDHN